MAVSTLLFLVGTILVFFVGIFSFLVQKVKSGMIAFPFAVLLAAAVAKYIGL